MRRPIVWAMAGAVFGVALSGAAMAAGYDIAANCATVPLNFVFDGTPKAVQVANGNPAGFICSGTTYVPIRFVAEALGKTVSWDGATNTVSVTTPTTATANPPATTGSQTSESSGGSATVGTTPSAGTNTPPAPQASSQTWTAQGIQFSNLTLTPSGSGTSVNVTVTNTTPVDGNYRYTLTFQDASGNTLGTASGSVFLYGNQAQNEQLSTTDNLNGYATVQVQVSQGATFGG